MTPNRLHAVATIVGLAIWICIDPPEYLSNFISFLSRMCNYLTEHEKYLHFFTSTVEACSVQRLVSEDRFAEDYLQVHMIARNVLLMRSHITIEENLYEESYFLI